MQQDKSIDFDAVVIGAGLTGMYQLYRLRSLGLKVRGFDKNGEVGGTWNMNRYPGCRLDSESYTYAYSFLKDLLEEWDWKEEFASQPELNEFFSKAADKMDIRKDIQFNTGVVNAIFDESRNLWELELDNADVVTCRFLVTCMGVLSNPIMPNIKGNELFRGRSFHSYYWPHEKNSFGGKQVDFAGKRVGVIGTGATGVQIITEVAKTAGELFVFQRHANWCAPLCNTPIEPDRMANIRQNYAEIFATCDATWGGFKHEFRYGSVKEHSKAEREALFEQLYNEPGFGIWLGHYLDTLLDKDANAIISEFMEKKIRGRINDQKIADKLIPKDHGFGIKRVPMETNYYEVYNQPNVHLVDIMENPIEEITPEGIRTTAEHYDLDVIIYATGFDAIIGAFKAVNFHGRGGKTLKEAWADGPFTYLGLQIPDFPNLFTVLGAHNGATFCNVSRCAEWQADWITAFFKHIVETGTELVEADPEAAEAWTEHCYEVVKNSLFPGYTHSYFFQAFGSAEKSRDRFLFYFGGNPLYRQKCSEVASNGYEGFNLTKAAQSEEAMQVPESVAS
jgi:cyclohexanone monooxygenase